MMPLFLQDMNNYKYFNADDIDKRLVISITLVLPEFNPMTSSKIFKGRGPKECKIKRTDK